MLLYYQRTQKGRVVYKHKKNLFTWRDVLRIAFRVPVDSELTEGQAALLLLWVEMQLEKFNGGPPAATNLLERLTLWWNALDREKQSKWMTELRNLYPEQTMELYIAWESYGAMATIKLIDEANIQKLIADLTAENEALREQVAELTRRLAAKK